MNTCPECGVAFDPVYNTPVCVCGVRDETPCPGCFGVCGACDADEKQPESLAETFELPGWFEIHLEMKVLDPALWEKLTQAFGSLTSAVWGFNEALEKLRPKRQKRQFSRYKRTKGL